MNCCSRHIGAAQTCFGWMSKRYERRYRRKGLDDNQLQLVRELESMGLDGLTLLEVGCGVGALHQTLLEKGASTATGIDLAPRMLQLAESRAKEREYGGEYLTILVEKGEYNIHEYGYIHQRKNARCSRPCAQRTSQGRWQAQAGKPSRWSRPYAPLF